MAPVTTTTRPGSSYHLARNMLGNMLAMRSRFSHSPLRSVRRGRTMGTNRPIAHRGALCPLQRARPRLRSSKSPQSLLEMPNICQRNGYVTVELAKETCEILDETADGDEVRQAAPRSRVRCGRIGGTWARREACASQTNTSTRGCFELARGPNECGTRAK